MRVDVWLNSSNQTSKHQHFVCHKMSTFRNRSWCPSQNQRPTGFNRTSITNRKSHSKNAYVVCCCGRVDMRHPAWLKQPAEMRNWPQRIANDTYGNFLPQPQRPNDDIPQSCVTVCRNYKCATFRFLNQKDRCCWWFNTTGQRPVAGSAYGNERVAFENIFSSQTCDSLAKLEDHNVTTTSRMSKLWIVPEACRPISYHKNVQTFRIAKLVWNIYKTRGYGLVAITQRARTNRLQQVEQEKKLCGIPVACWHIAPRLIEFLIITKIDSKSLQIRAPICRANGRPIAERDPHKMLQQEDNVRRTDKKIATAMRRFCPAKVHTHTNATICILTAWKLITNFNSFANTQTCRATSRIKKNCFEMDRRRRQAGTVRIANAIRVLNLRPLVRDALSLSDVVYSTRCGHDGDTIDSSEGQTAIKMQEETTSGKELIEGRNNTVPRGPLTDPWVLVVFFLVCFRSKSSAVEYSCTCIMGSLLSQGGGG